MQSHIKTLQITKRINVHFFEVIEVCDAFVNYLDTEYKNMILDYLNNWLCSPIFFEVMIIDETDAWIKC